MAFDTVVSIGGQSFTDGIWRLFGPALEGLANPIPIAIPGVANARMRVKQLVPVFPGLPTDSGALRLRADVELTGEALIQILVESRPVNLPLGALDLALTDLAGSITEPLQSGTLSNIRFPGAVGNLAGGTGEVTLPGGPVSLADGTATGTLTPAGDLALPGIALPKIVPVPIDFTGETPLRFDATLSLTVEEPDSIARAGLLFAVSDVSVSSGGSTLSAQKLADTLEAEIDRILGDLAVPDALAQPPLDRGKIAALASSIPGLIATTLGNALSGLLAATGRLIYPPPGTGASCDSRMLPTSVEAALAVGRDGAYVLQVGCGRAASTGNLGFPEVTEPIECNLLVANGFLLQLLCCLVERLPAFSLPIPPVLSTTDLGDSAGTHLGCCNFRSVTANFGGIAIGNGEISVCIDEGEYDSKRFSLLGSFSHNIRFHLVRILGVGVPLGNVRVAVDFALPLAFDLDDLSSLANLRVLGATQADVEVTPNLDGALILVAILSILAPTTLLLTGILAPLGLTLGAIMGSVIVVLLLLLVHGACGVARRLLRNAVNTLLSGASLLKSPVALPPGLFEAFGKFVPASVTIDDLESRGVLNTPTRVWGLLPRLGAGLSPKLTSLTDPGEAGRGGIREANEGVAMSLPPPAVPGVTPITPPVAGGRPDLTEP